MRCVKGRVLDVAVDTRKGSPTYGKHVAVELTKANPAPNSDNCIISIEWFNLENLNNENDEL